MNLSIFHANIATDIELRHTTSGTAVCNFVLAVERAYKNNRGELEKKVAFPQMEAWSTAAETIAKHFRKGDGILVEASLVQDDWMTKEGEKRRSLKFRVERFYFPKSKKWHGDEEVASEVSTEESETPELAASF